MKNLATEGCVYIPFQLILVVKLMISDDFVGMHPVVDRQTENQIFGDYS